MMISLVFTGSICHKVHFLVSFRQGFCDTNRNRTVYYDDFNRFSVRMSLLRNTKKKKERINGPVAYPRLFLLSKLMIILKTERNGYSNWHSLKNF